MTRTTGSVAGANDSSAESKSLWHDSISKRVPWSCGHNCSLWNVLWRTSPYPEPARVRFTEEPTVSYRLVSSVQNLFCAAVLTVLGKHRRAWLKERRAACSEPARSRPGTGLVHSRILNWSAQQKKQNENVLRRGRGVEKLGVEPSTSCRNMCRYAKHALYQMSYIP
ncbi:hypothetical protein DL546_003953 [Coniochaeta pulveracea]|uniref:Uncharacterized protein n=1 Tax=Coniochaeta pulveracea TaxID=177199 RepID=A0A420YHH8_9PEZI|nr:hypothetical protein DL546_003953 [Coniochaeta pulveracea]